MKPTSGSKGKKREVPVIQLVPPVIFIRRKKTDFIRKAFHKLTFGIFFNGKLRKVANNSANAKSKQVYSN